VALDVVLLTAAYYSAFVLRVGWAESSRYLDTFWQTLPVILAISVLVHGWHNLYSGILRYTSTDTALAVLKSVLWAVLLSCLVLFLLYRLHRVPRSVFVIYGMEALLLIGGIRLVFRFPLRRKPGQNATRVLLYGAGDTGELVLRGLRASFRFAYAPVGMIDDDPSKHGKQIHGVRIFGGVEALSGILERNRVDEVWVAVHKLAGERLRKVYEVSRARGVRVKILPRLESALLATDLDSFQEPDIADLLRRPSRSLNREQMRSWLRGRRVLITGAGGSVGSELARQVGRLGPEALALCDNCECNLFHIHRELAALNGKGLEEPYLVDIRDAPGVERMFRETRPEIVFHAAAYKHVPLVELNPCEGVVTNVQGLCHVALAARAHGARELVFISTDKAVRPVSVMGATKRLGEIVIQLLNKEGGTRFCGVRFGNVLGSSGSVVPIFKEQIRHGGPLTVTHPDMTRYFMLTSEAVELVIQAGSLGKGGEIFVLDMGQPVRIADMAQELIRLMGKEPQRDIQIEFTGTRPGEKIHEELLIDSDDSRTSCPDVWIDGAAPPDLEWPALAERLGALFEASRNGDRATALAILSELVTTFEPVESETLRALRFATEVATSTSSDRLSGGVAGAASPLGVGAKEREEPTIHWPGQSLS
jgi:FlaA1/EpsC-like NDP-sugar epimerase